GRSRPQLRRLPSYVGSGVRHSTPTRPLAAEVRHSKISATGNVSRAASLSLQTPRLTDTIRMMKTSVDTTDLIPEKSVALSDYSTEQRRIEIAAIVAFAVLALWSLWRLAIVAD